jgi:hypothetical protein
LRPGLKKSPRCVSPALGLRLLFATLRLGRCRVDSRSQPVSDGREARVRRFSQPAWSRSSTSNAIPQGGLSPGRSILKKIIMCVTFQKTATKSFVWLHSLPENTELKVGLQGITWKENKLQILT